MSGTAWWLIGVTLSWIGFAIIALAFAAAAKLGDRIMERTRRPDADQG